MPEVKREPLNTSQITVAAVEMADAEGVASLSMRKLAKQLGFEVMSLYNHVKNKSQLFDLMVEHVSAEVVIENSATDPIGAVRALAISTRELYVHHPWVMSMALTQIPGPVRVKRMDELLRLFSETGLTPELAHIGFHAVNNHVLGYSIQAAGMQLADDNPETSAEAFIASISDGEFPNMVAHVEQHLRGETGRSFEFVLDLILDGLVSKHVK